MKTITDVVSESVSKQVTETNVLVLNKRGYSTS